MNMSDILMRYLYLKEDIARKTREFKELKDIIKKSNISTVFNGYRIYTEDKKVIKMRSLS